MDRPIEKRPSRDPTTGSPRPNPPPAKSPRNPDEHLYGGGDNKPGYRDSDPAERQRDESSRRNRDDLDDS